MAKFEELLQLVKRKTIGQRRLFIQTHDFPDHDACATAYGLQMLFSLFNIQSSIVYNGDIQRGSLSEMLNGLSMKLHNASEMDIKELDTVIIVDGCKGSKNVSNLQGEEIAIIDHHQVKAPEDVPFADIRSDYGSCSTLIWSYFDELGLPLPGNVATALLVGLFVDTARLTRGVSDADINAFYHLYLVADYKFMQDILRNNIEIKDLDYFRVAMNNVQIEDYFAFCYFPDGCTQNLLGILGDFFLGLQEIDFVVLCARNENKINVSVRNEKTGWNAAFILQTVLDDIGYGGGHSHMAGGVVLETTRFDAEDLRMRFLSILGLRKKAK